MGTRSSTGVLCGQTLHRETCSLAMLVDELAVAGAQLSGVGMNFHRIAWLGHEPQVAGAVQATLEAQEAVLSPLHSQDGLQVPTCWGQG